MSKPDLESVQGLSYQEVLQLVELIKASTHFTEFRFRSGSIEIELRRGPEPSVTHAPAAAEIAGNEHPISSAAAGNAAGKEREVGSAGSLPAGATVIRSPMVGVFYRAPEPGAAPFVEVGAKVDAERIVCIIEVMKLMNSIPAGRSGTVSRILVGDGEAVEYGQPLIVIDPS